MKFRSKSWCPPFFKRYEICWSSYAFFLHKLSVFLVFSMKKVSWRVECILLWGVSAICPSWIFVFISQKKNDFSVWLSLFPSVEGTWPNLSNSIVMQTSPIKCFPWNNEGYPWCYKTKVMKILIKTIIKFSNVIGYHQPDLSTNRTVYASCLYLDCV